MRSAERVGKCLMLGADRKLRRAEILAFPGAAHVNADRSPGII
jgi:hypothetical protein